MRSVPYRALTFLVAFLLLASPVLAAGPRVHGAEEAQGLFAEFWHTFRQLVPILVKGRAGQDPNGIPLPEPTGSGATSEPETEGRAGQDPNG